MLCTEVALFKEKYEIIDLLVLRSDKGVFKQFVCMLRGWDVLGKMLTLLMLRTGDGGMEGLRQNTDNHTIIKHSGPPTNTLA